MSKDRIKVRLSFERGRIRNGGLIETKVFRQDRKKEKRISPKNTVIENKTNKAHDYYELSGGRNYRFETVLIKHGRQRFCRADLAIDSRGQVSIKKWRGHFRPRFSLP